MGTSGSKFSISKSPWGNDNALKEAVKDKNKITSLILLSATDVNTNYNRFQAILRGSIPFGYSYSDKVVFDENLQKEVIRKVRNEDSGKNVAIFQKALYLYFLAHTNIVNQDISYPLVQANYRGVKKLANGIITGVYDLETEIYVCAFQAITGIYSGNFNTMSSEVRGALGFGIINPKTIIYLDYFINEIKYYSFETGKPFIYHNNSICLDGNMSLVTVANQSSAFVYQKPDASSSKIAELIPLKSKVYVIQDITNYLDGWLYVQVDFNSSIHNNQELGITGYVKKSKFLLRSNAPDADAEAYKIEPGDTPYSIVKKHFYTYHSNENEWRNSRNLKIRTEPTTLPVLNPLTLSTVEINRKEANQFKFYMNLLLFANNKFGILPQGGEESIYLTYPASAQSYSNVQNWEEKYAKICPSASPYTFLEDGSLSNHTNYDYFLERLKNVDNGFHWDYVDDDTVMKVIEGRHLWLPSKKFADSLYAFINQDIDYLHEIAEAVRETAKSIWPRGFGVKIEGDIGATFGIPIRLEVGGSVYLERKFTHSDDEFVLVLRKSGRLRVGVDFGAGAGFYVGTGTKRRPDYGLGAQIHAQIGAGAELDGYFEYEFVLGGNAGYPVGSKSQDLATLALLTSVLSTAGPAVEFLALQIAKSFTDYNFDPNNYLVKSEITFKGYVEGSVGAMAGIFYGDEESVDYWNNDPDNLPDKPENPQWLLRTLIANANVSFGASFSVVLGVGFVYEAQYYSYSENGDPNYSSEKFDHRTGVRIPKKFSLSVKTNLEILENANVSIPIFGSIPLIDNDKRLGLRFNQSYTRTINANNTYYKFVQDYDDPMIEFTAGSGNYEEFDGNAFEIGIQINHPSNNSINSLVHLTDLINSLTFRRRVDLLSLSYKAPVNIKTAQDKLKRYFSNGKKFSRFGGGIGAFFDFDFSITWDDFTNDFLPNLSALLIEIRNQIAEKEGVSPENVNWLKVILYFPRYLSVFISEEVKEEFVDLYQSILRTFHIDKFAFHGEIYFGAAFGFRVGAGFKAALDARIKVTLSYDQNLVVNNVWLIPLNDDSDEEQFNETELAQQLKDCNLTNEELITFAISTLAGMPTIKL